MFSTAFVTKIIEPAAAGNPAVISAPMTWSAHLVARHIVACNTGFALIQFAIGAGLLFGRTTKAALAASIAWSVGVWWFGEGLGGVLAGGSPLTGLPGAVILYALIAVLIWPPARDGPGSATLAPASGRTAEPGLALRGTAGPGLALHAGLALRGAAGPGPALHGAAGPGPALRGTAGPGPALRGTAGPGPALHGAAGPGPALHGTLGPLVPKLAWLVLWGGSAWYLLLPGNRAPDAVSRIFAAAPAGWAGFADSSLASVTAGRGLAVSVLAAVLCALTGLMIFSRRLARPAVLLACLLGWTFWLAEGFGGLATGQATDPNTGPVLILLALCFWPPAPAPRPWPPGPR
jgi:hypothetical protein